MLSPTFLCWSQHESASTFDRRLFLHWFSTDLRLSPVFVSTRKCMHILEWKLSTLPEIRYSVLVCKQQNLMLISNDNGALNLEWQQCCRGPCAPVEDLVLLGDRQWNIWDIGLGTGTEISETYVCVLRFSHELLPSLSLVMTRKTAQTKFFVFSTIVTTLTCDQTCMYLMSACLLALCHIWK